MVTPARPWPTSPRYLARSDGSILGPSGRVLRPWVVSGRYLQVNTCTAGRVKAESVHVIVCEAWHGPRPEGMEVAHENRDGFDCRPDNLRWATHVDNCADKINHGTQFRGEQIRNQHATRLTADQVREIRALAAEGMPQVAIATRFHMSQTGVGQIVRRQTWRHVS